MHRAGKGQGAWAASPCRVGSKRRRQSRGLLAHGVAGDCAHAFMPLRVGQAPTFWEEYSKGSVGLGAMSKWVPEDHPPTHPKCKLHDIDCDELFPWGKVCVKERLGE